jgi:hypothetical protein
MNDVVLVQTVLTWPQLIIDWTYTQNKKNMFHRIAQHQSLEVLKTVLDHAENNEEDFASAIIAEMFPGDQHSRPLYLCLPNSDMVRLFAPYYDTVGIDWEFLRRKMPDFRATV